MLLYTFSYAWCVGLGCWHWFGRDKPLDLVKPSDILPPETISDLNGGRDPPVFKLPVHDHQFEKDSSLPPSSSAIEDDTPNLWDELPEEVHEAPIQPMESTESSSLTTRAVLTMLLCHL